MKMNLISALLFTGGFVFLSAFAAPETVNEKSVKADNSAVNKTSDLNAQQQSSQAKDVEITRLLRKELMQNKDLSTYAQNIKIVTINGEITLKGPVRTATEADFIVKKANVVPGVINVYNQMNVVPQ